LRWQAQSLRDIVHRNFFVGEGDDGWYWASKIAHVSGFPHGPLPSAQDAKRVLGSFFGRGLRPPQHGSHQSPRDILSDTPALT
jgi:hypothetical protein